MIHRLLFCCAAMLAVAFGWSEDAKAEEVTFYDSSYCGGVTASGNVLDCSTMQAAHPHLPLGSEVTVCFDGCVTVTVVDRGPTTDLTPAAAAACGIVDVGRIDLPLIVH
jgi:rare lipoprotein A